MIPALSLSWTAIKCTQSPRCSQTLLCLRIISGAFKASNSNHSLLFKIFRKSSVAWFPHSICSVPSVAGSSPPHILLWEELVLSCKLPPCDLYLGLSSRLSQQVWLSLLYQRLLWEKRLVLGVSSAGTRATLGRTHKHWIFPPLPFSLTWTDQEHMQRCSWISHIFVTLLSWGQNRIRTVTVLKEESVVLYLTRRRSMFSLWKRSGAFVGCNRRES